MNKKKKNSIQSYSHQQKQNWSLFQFRQFSFLGPESLPHLLGFPLQLCTPVQPVGIRGTRG
jgi:hypothetical protein